MGVQQKKKIFGERLRKEVMEKVVFKMVPEDYLELHGEIWAWKAITDGMI